MSLTSDPDFAPVAITVETKTGDGERGATYAPPVTRTVFVEGRRRQVRGPDGKLTVSETTVFDTIDQAATYTPNSRVTVNGRPALVVSVATNRIGDPDVDHIAVALT